MINLHDGIRMVEFAQWNSHDEIRMMEPARWNVQKVTMRRSRGGESVHRIRDLERTQDAIIFLVRIADILVCSYCGKVRTDYLPQSALRPRYRPLFLPKAILQKYPKHCTKTPVSSTKYSVVYKVLSAHPSLIENCAGRVKSYNPIHDNGVYKVESTRWNLHGGIYTMESTRWNLHDHAIRTRQCARYNRTMQFHKAIHAMQMRPSAQCTPHNAIRTTTFHNRYKSDKG